MEGQESERQRVRAYRSSKHGCTWSRVGSGEIGGPVGGGAWRERSPTRSLRAASGFAKLMLIVNRRSLTFGSTNPCPTSRPPAYSVAIAAACRKGRFSEVAAEPARHLPSPLRLESERERCSGTPRRGPSRANNSERNDRDHTFSGVVCGLVCKKCNNGWMSELESDSKQILGELIDRTTKLCDLSMMTATLWPGGP